MRRLPDWQERLAAFLEPLREQPFAWGRHDCCTLAAGAVLAMTGVDAMGEFRGRYSTAIGSARALRRYGAGDLPATMTAKFGALGPAALAQRGDIVLVQGALGVALGSVAAVVGSQGEREGLLREPRAAWAGAWHIPY